jgi:hypothetical protein
MKQCEVCGKELTETDEARNRAEVSDQEPVAWLCGDHLPTYRVWVCIERHDPVTDEYEETDTPFGDGGEFETYAEALKAAEALHHEE